MKTIPAALILALCASLPRLALADCREIVDSTVAEIRAGAAEWNEDMERLARAAAGSACVKAGGNRAPAAVASQLEEKPVRGGAAETSAEAAPASNSAAAGGESGEDWHPLKGFKFNPVTGSPGKKPYERRREVNETEAEQNRE